MPITEMVIASYPNSLNCGYAMPELNALLVVV